MMSRFTVKKIKDGFYCCFDNENHFSIEFEEHKFDETQNVVFEDLSSYDFMQVARLLREMGDWLFENYYDLIF
jgi:hypothetical protein